MTSGGRGYVTGVAPRCEAARRAYPDNGAVKVGSDNVRTVPRTRVRLTLADRLAAGAVAGGTLTGYTAAAIAAPVPGGLVVLVGAIAGLASVAAWEGLRRVR